MKQQLTARKTRKTKVRNQAPAKAEISQRTHTTRPRDLASSRSSRSLGSTTGKQRIQCKHQRP